MNKQSDAQIGRLNERISRIEKSIDKQQKKSLQIHTEPKVEEQVASKRQYKLPKST